MRYRYGEFRVDDYIFAFLPGCVFIAAAIVLLVIGDDSSKLYAYLGGLIGVLLIAVVVIPRLEKFSLTGNAIRIRKGLFSSEIALPNEMILIISGADVATATHATLNPIALSMGVSLLHGRYAVTILQKMPLDSVLKQIHIDHVPRYTNATIEAICTYEFVYSFVVNESLLNDFLAERNCLVIVPESISYQFRSVLMAHPEVALYVDLGY